MFQHNLVSHLKMTIDLLDIKGEIPYNYHVVYD